MNKLFLVIFIICTVYSAFGQKTEFGLSYEAGIVLTGKEKTAKKELISSAYPWTSEVGRPFSIWNTQHLKFDIYPNQIQGLSISVGFRLFSYGWETDTVSTAYYAMGSWTTLYGRRESKLSYLTPTLSIGYEFSLLESLKLKCSMSFGPQAFAFRHQQHSYAFDEVHEEPFLKMDAELRDGDWNYGSIDMFDAQLSSQLSYCYKGLSIYAGPSLYLFNSSDADHLGLQLTGGISYRFAKD